jgi:ADP-ribose pyrophosphatase
MPSRRDVSPYTFESSEVEYRNPFLTIRKLEGTDPSGGFVRLFVREEEDVAVCIPIRPDGSIVMVKEFRPGPSRYLTEVPGGLVDPGEEPVIAAAREVLEETGYAGDIRHLGVGWISAYSSQRKHIFIMLNAQRVAEPEPTPVEISEVVILSAAELQDVVHRGDLTDLDAGLLVLREIAAGRT